MGDQREKLVGQYLYIMSRPHSGSTILDIMLGSSPEIAGCGEIIMGMEFRHENWRCSCGELVDECPVWSGVRKQMESEPGFDWERFAEASVRQSEKTQIPRTWLASSNPSRLKDEDAWLVRQTIRLRDAIAGAMDSPNILDSSKRPSRGLFLLKYLNDVRIIHIVRDPRSMVASFYRRFQINDTYLALERPYKGWLEPLAYVEASVMWFLGNLLFEIIGMTNRNQVVRIQYEDLTRQPANVLRTLQDKLAIDLSDPITRLENDESFTSGHMLGGSLERTKSEIRFNAQRDQSRKYPAYLDWLTTAFCFPLMLRYGYPLGSRQSVGKPATTST